MLHVTHAGIVGSGRDRCDTLLVCLTKYLRIDKTTADRVRSGLKRRVGRATRATLRSMRVQKFHLFFGGQLISQVANWLTLVAQTLPYCTTASGVLTARAVIVGVWMMNPHELRAAPITPRSKGQVRARCERRAQLERGSDYLTEFSI